MGDGLRAYEKMIAGVLACKIGVDDDFALADVELYWKASWAKK